MPIPSTKKMVAQFTLPIPYLLEAVKRFTKLEAKGHNPYLAAFSKDFNNGIVGVHIICLECEYFFNPTASIKKCTYKRPSSKGRYPDWPKGKK